MSHFTLAVITKGEPTYKQLEEILAPFNEILEVETFKTKEEIIKEEREKLGKYFETTYREYLSDPEKYRESCSNEKHLEYLEKEFPKKLTWTDEEIYQDVIRYEEDEDIMEDGRVRSTYNPNGKWDWWVIGGRWKGSIKTKDGKEVDSARIKDIIVEDKELYNKMLRDWELIVEESKPINEKEEERIKWNLYTTKYFIDTYKTKEEYARLQSQFTTYAILDKEGNWIEPGRMGWFGMSNAEAEDEYNFMNNYYKTVFENAEEDDWLTVIDCHI